jgi:hypothetical protein
VGTYIVKEDGKNGTIEVFDDRIERVLKKLIGKPDEETIPMRAITGVKLDKKLIGSPTVFVQTASHKYEWKIKNGEEFAKELNSKLYPSN